MYLLRLALRPWRMSPLSQVFSAFAVGFLLFLAGFLFWLQHGLNPVLARLSGEQVVTAYVAPSVDSKDSVEKVMDSIRTSLGAHADGELADVQFVDTPDFLGNIKARYPDLAKELEELGPESNLIVPRYVSVAGVLPANAVDSIKSIPGIEAAETSKDRYRHVVGAFMAVRWVARVLAVGICLALLTGLIHLSRMNSYLHRDAMGILKLWGAGIWQLKAPGMISGLAVGLLGGIIAVTSWLTFGRWIFTHIRELSPMLRDLQVPATVMNAQGLAAAATLLVLGALLGLMAGTLGSSTK